MNAALELAGRWRAAFFRGLVVVVAGGSGCDGGAPRRIALAARSGSDSLERRARPVLGARDALAGPEPLAAGAAGRAVSDLLASLVAVARCASAKVSSRADSGSTDASSGAATGTLPKRGRSGSRLRASPRSEARADLRRKGGRGASSHARARRKGPVVWATARRARRPRPLPSSAPESGGGRGGPHVLGVQQMGGRPSRRRTRLRLALDLDRYLLLQLVVLAARAPPRAARGASNLGSDGVREPNFVRP